METTIRKIGNSLGVLLPKKILEQISIQSDREKIKISVEDGKITIEKISSPRQGWAEAILKDKTRKQEDLAEHISNDFDKEEWTW